MSNPSVLAVLINYARPANMPKVIAAWKGQSVEPARLVVVDNRPRAGKPGPLDGKELDWYPESYLAGADDVWRMTQNLGCSCRLAPALMLHDCEYVMFADDDYLPGSRALEYLLKTAEYVGDQFATLGEIGRTFRLGMNPGERYRYGNTARNESRPTQCDTVCRGSLMKRKLLTPFASYRERLLELSRGTIAELVDIHDDLLVSLMIQQLYHVPSYITAISQDIETRLIKEELPGSNDSTALYKRPNHLVERNLFVDIAITTGWKRPNVDKPELGSEIA